MELLHHSSGVNGKNVQVERVTAGGAPRSLSPAVALGPLTVRQWNGHINSLNARDGRTPGRLSTTKPDRISRKPTIRDTSQLHAREHSQLAEVARKPWDAFNGIGEQKAAEAYLHLPWRAAAQLPEALRPASAVEEAVMRQAGQVLRRGGGQRFDEASWQPHEGVVARVLWPVDMVDKPRHCVACRGKHDQGKVASSSWNPYTPQMRLSNLHMLASKFQVALLQNRVPTQLDPDNKKTGGIRWVLAAADGGLLTPDKMSKEDFLEFLPLAFEGMREGHEPHRHLASQTALQLLATRSPYIADAAPGLIRPIRLAFNTMEPSLVGHMLQMLQRLLQSHQGVGLQLVAKYHLLLPPVAMFRSSKKTLWLPPPHCLGSTGSFSGSKAAPEAGRRMCKVCGVPVDKVLASKRVIQRASAAQDEDAGLYDPEKGEAHEYCHRTGAGRFAHRYALADVVAETLECMVKHGGRGGLLQVQRVVPTFSRINPIGVLKTAQSRLHSLSYGM